VSQVGALMAPTIVFSPPRSGYVVDITLNFTVPQGAEEYEVFNLTLPGFTGPAFFEHPLRAESDGKPISVLATWIPAEQILTFFPSCGDKIGRGHFVQIFVAQARNLRLPVLGIRNTTRATLALNSKNGNVLSAPVLTPAVGMLKDSTFDVQP